MSDFLATIPVVDAHHHLWAVAGGHYPKFVGPPDGGFFLGDYQAIACDFLPDDYRHAARGHNVVATVHIEAEWRRDDQLGESRWVDAIAREHGLPDAFVGHAWFDDPRVESVLEAHASFARLRGIRSKPALPGETGTRGEGRGSMRGSAWRRGYALLARYGLRYDLRVPHTQLAEAAELVAMHDDIPVVLNHTGFPWDRSEAGLAAWRRSLAAIAVVPHVYLKLSELGLANAPWTYADNRRVILGAIDIFGVQRCMFASNFPVARLRIEFDALFQAYKSMVADFSEPEQLALFHDNAARFYDIPFGAARNAIPIAPSAGS